MSDSRVTIRAAVASDMAAVTAIYAHAVRHGRGSFELDPPDEAEMTRRHAAIAAAGYPYLVGEAAGEVVGYAYCSAYRPRPAYASTVEGSVYLAPGRQGQGIGRQLLTSLVAAAEQAGFRQMVAVIGDSANAASIRLHHRLGFAMVGTLRAVGWKHERWLDTVLMQRALGVGDTEPPTLAERRP